uniref:Uncharacterized protein n=1 Tax=Knipowitschia caucasica TaxID=637954 RepID=A0AAV2LLV1_KNICA
MASWQELCVCRLEHDGVETWESNGTTRHRQSEAGTRTAPPDRLRAAADHEERAAQKPRRGPAEQPAERARRGGEQWGYANHSRCRDVEEEQTTSSQTEDSRATRTSNT